LILPIFSISLMATSYPYFTKNEFFHIKKDYGVIAKNRVLDYQKTISSYKALSKENQLLKVNFYLNQLLPQYDDIVQNKVDYWASPKEFLMIGFGDCEDYVIIKYFTLIKLGFDKEKLFFTTVFEKHLRSYHMVLSYFDKNGKAPLILDNLSFRVLRLDVRKDLKADTFINESGVYRLKDNKLIKIETHSPKFEELHLRVKKES